MVFASGRDIKMHARFQTTDDRLVEHFQQHESPGRLDKALSRSDLRPAVDINVGSSTRRALLI